MKLAEIMNKPAFQNVFVLAGKEGLENELEKITMMDAPDIIDFLHPKDFLVTTAYHLKDNPEQLLELIQQMYQKKCSGVGIKTKRFLLSVPEKVIQFANEHHFPILEIPIETSLGEIVTGTLNYMLNERTTELTTAFETHRKFTQHILKGKGIKRLLDELAQMIGKKIILLDSHFQIHPSSNGKGTISKFFTSLHTAGFQIFLRNTAFTCFSSRITEEVFTIFPIHTHIGRPAYLIVLGELSIQEQRLLLTIEQATNVLSFELMRENTVKQYDRRARDDFFHRLVEEKFTSIDEIIDRAKEFSLKKEQPSMVIIGKIDTEEPQNSFTSHPYETDFIYEFLENELTNAPFPAQLFRKEDLCIILIELKISSSDIDAKILSYLQNIQGYIYTIFKRSISFGLSNVLQRLVHLPNAYKEALSALHTGQLSGNSPFIQAHRPKDVSELLRMIPSKELKEFEAYIFQSFTTEKQMEDKQMLLHTLSVYLETHCQISETAKRLYVHRNTVIYRLEKCEELLGASLKDPEVTFHLRLAFRIQSLLQIK